MDSVRRDFFYNILQNIYDDFSELKDDFVKFTNCHSIYTETCTSHYTIFYGDYFNKSKNDNFPAQLKKLGFIPRSFCNGAIVVSYPAKDIVEKEIMNYRPFRDKIINDLGIEPEFNWKKRMFGQRFEDFFGAADDEERNIPKKWKNYIKINRDNNNFIFLHFWNTHAIYGINEYLEDKIVGKNYIDIGKELISRIKNGDLTLDFVRDIYSKRINELISIYIKDLINILKENGIYDDSVIIITADHGEGLGEVGENYNEIFINLYETIFKYYNLLRGKLESLPKIDRKYYFKWDHNTFYHGIHKCQKKIPLLIKFPNNEFGGKSIEAKVTLFDIIHTIDDLLGNKLDIKKNYGCSLYFLLKLGHGGRRKYKIRRKVKDLDSRKLGL